MNKRKRRLYMIPGLGESTRMNGYREVAAFARERGLVVVPIAIDWSDTLTMKEYVAQADDKIPDVITDDYILGFSFGAYIASILSDKKQARGYIFSSVSPYFKENIPEIPDESKRYFGRKFMNSLKSYAYPKGGRGHAWFLIGDKDWRLAQRVAKVLRSRWPGPSTLEIVSGAGHDLKDSKYLAAIKKIVKTL